MIITLEGNIGAGKSSLLAKLENVTFDEPHTIMLEPVEDWMNFHSKPGHKSLFEMFYEDKKRYGFSFQMYALKSRFEHFLKVVQTNPDKLILCERCPLTDCNIFAKLLRDEGVISEHEFAVYESWYKFVMNTINIDIAGIIYLRVEPDVCVKRINKRNRKGEQCMEKKYVEHLHTQHEDWLSHIDNIHIVDGNGPECDIEGIRAYVNNIIKQRNKMMQ